MSFPTYHCHPSRSALEFVEKIPVQEKPLKAYVLTTCAMYRGNSLRILARRLLKKNIITTGHATIRGPASDGSVMFPVQFRMLYRYRKNTVKKLGNTTGEISDIVERGIMKKRIPVFSWYTPLNAPNKYFGLLSVNTFKKKMSISSEWCINCGMCVRDYERNCYTAGDDLPSYNYDNC